MTRWMWGIAATVAAANTWAAELPAITGRPVVDAPALLAWPEDRALVGANISEPTANTLNDLHGRMEGCDLAISTAGNYHMALRDLWEQFAQAHSGEMRTWAYTTSPPVAVDQLKHGRVVIGNMEMACRPQVVVAPKRVVDKVVADGLADGLPVEVFRNRGNVILVKKGNPKRIRSVWDLGRRDVRIVTPNPNAEKGSFENYAESLYRIAAQDPKPPQGKTAQWLFDQVYNGASGVSDKWLTGVKIHHRETAWSIAHGKADATVIFYHLALNMARTFPDKFEIVPLGGTAENPQPRAGNKIGVHYAVAIKGDWSSKQTLLRDEFLAALVSEGFRSILAQHGMTTATAVTRQGNSTAEPAAGQLSRAPSRGSDAADDLHPGQHAH